jgi:hypothetical protein
MTKAAIQELDWEILPHPPYSPDLAPLDYLFCSLSDNLHGMKFPSTTLSSKIDSTSSWPNQLISSSVGSKTWLNVGKQS